MKHGGSLNGACQGILGRCRADAVLFLSHSHFFTLKFGVEQGSNNRVELFAFWISLKFALEKDIRSLQVLGDSKLVVDWFNGKCQINNLVLSPLLDKIREVGSLFGILFVEHLYREFNTMVDGLSKDFVAQQEGLLLSHEFNGEESFPVISQNLF
jgi:ribonuclease HI